MILQILSTRSVDALPAPTPSLAHQNAAFALPDPSTLPWAKPPAAAAPPAPSPTHPASCCAYRVPAPTLMPASNPAPSFPTATALMQPIATRTAALPAATFPTEPPCASVRLRAATQSVAAPTAALQPTCSTAASQARHHASSAPPATAHARHALPAASAPLRARAIRSCAMQALTPPLLAQRPPQSAPPALRAHIHLLLARLHAPSALPAPTALRLRRSRVAAPSTRIPPCEAAAPAALALGKLYPQRDRSCA